MQVVYIRAGDTQPSEALREWLERRGIDYQVAWIGLAMPLDEAEMEALAEREDVLLIRTPIAGEPLPEWHYLVSGDRESVHRAGQPTRGWTISEIDAGDLEYHVVERAL